jgi:hypothetical protein
MSVIVTSLKCPKCGDVIYSRAHHDFHSCTCGAVSIDGGFDYTRYMGLPEIFAQLKLEPLEVDSTKQELFDDWNKRIDKLGRILAVNNVSVVRGQDVKETKPAEQKKPKKTRKKLPVLPTRPVRAKKGKGTKRCRQ